MIGKKGATMNPLITAIENRYLLDLLLADIRNGDIEVDYIYPDICQIIGNIVDCNSILPLELQVSIEIN